MAIVELTKKQVIRLLREEKLTSGVWIRFTRDRAANCPVCAVGSVVRACMSEEARADDVNKTASRLACYYESAHRSRRLLALSEAYERAVTNGESNGGTLGAKKADLERGRRAAIAHVRAKWPERVRIDIGDAKPREGMKVVG